MVSSWFPARQNRWKPSSSVVLNSSRTDEDFGPRSTYVAEHDDPLCACLLRSVGLYLLLQDIQKIKTAVDIANCIDDLRSFGKEEFLAHGGTI